MTPEMVEQDADILFKNMSGRYNDGAKRRSGDALALEGYTEDNFAHSGLIENDMVLAPAVVDWFPKGAACAECEGWVEFDCTMDTSHEDLILGSGCVNVDTDTVDWVNDHKVAFEFEPGEGDVVEMLVDAAKALSANNHDIHLDGNLNPEGTNAVAPNRTINGYDEDFVWTPECGNVCIAVSGFGTTGGGPCGAPACSSRNNGSFIMTWNPLGSRWEGYCSPCGNRYVYYDLGASQWKYLPQCMCGVLFYNDAASAQWPPETGWYPQSGHICGSGSMSLDYCGCN